MTSLAEELAREGELSPGASDDDWTELTKEDVHMEEEEERERVARVDDHWPAPVISPSISSHESTPMKESPEESLSSFPPIEPAPIKPEWKVREPLDQVTMERSNLINVFKLIVKELIDCSLSHGRELDDENVTLQQFFTVMDHILLHKIKAKKALLWDKKEYYQVLEKVEKFEPGAAGMNTSVQEMSIKSELGRGRAWLRLALMQKHLSDYFRLLIERKETILTDFYEPGAMMLEEEGMVISGLLVGLNVIDCNLCIKGEDLDQPLGIIDYSSYLKNSNMYGATEEPMKEAENTQLSTVLDQKNYLEELNRHLTSTVANLQAKSDHIQRMNAELKEELAIAKNDLLLLQDSNNQLTAEKLSLLEAHEKHIKSSESDISVERETYQSSREGLDHLYIESQQKLKEETRLRLDVEKELELQISMRTEIEMAMRLLEKDIHQKQDTVVNIRKQLEEIKGINLEMYNKLQASENSLQHKTQLVAKLEEKVQQMQQSIRDLEEKNKSTMNDKNAAEETARKLGQQIAERDIRRSQLETDLKIETEWRSGLQKSLDQEKEQNQLLHSEIDNLKQQLFDYQQLKQTNESLKQTCEDQEKALAELGSHLSESKLKMDEMLEEKLSYKEAQWTDDKEVNNCKLCAKPFSVSRRKHHCRHCGGIYCNECSDNKMPLPSSSKPVRVCDDCQTVLLQRYTAK